MATSATPPLVQLVAGKDPRLKHQIRAAINTLLFDRPLGENQKFVDRMVEKNCMLRSSDAFGFTYNSNYYIHSQSPHKNGLIMGLDPALRSSMKAFVMEQQELTRDMEQVSNYLASILNSSDCVQDYIAILPEILGSKLTQFKDQGSPVRMLSTDQVEEIKVKYSQGISLMRQRMVRNLLL